MSNQYQAYAEYKDSGVEWLGDVPEHWDIVAIKRKFRIVGGSTPKSDQETFWDGEIIWVTPSDLSKRSSSLFISDSQRKITENGLASCGTTLVPENSIILSTRAPIGSLAITETELCTNQGCKSLSPSNKTNSKFFGYLLSVSTTELNIRGKGTTFLELSGDELGGFKIPTPTISEQQKIANFLDHETAKIDTLIEKQQLLIKLLKEKRQAVISHAVTKGLNPNAPMRDSGVEWLGEVPEHWVTIKFGITNSSADLGGNYSSGDGEEGIPLIKMGNLGRGWVKLKKLEFIQKSEVYEKKYLLSEGDFLFNTRNSLALVGKVSIWRGELEKSLYNSNILKITFYEKFVGSNSFMNYLFNSDFGLSQLRLIAKGTTSVAAIYYKELKSLIYALPTPKEQVEISSFLDSESEKIGYLIEKSESAIELMQERRTALISAAVTGKIDVRNWQASNSESKAISA